MQLDVLLAAAGVGLLVLVAWQLMSGKKSPEQSAQVADSVEPVPPGHAAGEAVGSQSANALAKSAPDKKKKGDRKEENESGITIKTLREIAEGHWLAEEVVIKKKGVVFPPGSIVEVDEITQIWRTAPGTNTVLMPDKDTKFKSERLQKFFDSQVINAPWFQYSPVHANIVTYMLKILDDEGHVPSVVGQNVTRDVENKLDLTSYQMLGSVTLLDHTITVAELMIVALRNDTSKHMIPDAVIAALGHDFGKLPRAQKDLYSKGEHPLSSAFIMEAMPGFLDLKKNEEILQAIKLHHKAPADLVGKQLKQCDQHARKLELQKIRRKSREQSMPVADTQAVESTPLPAPSPSVPQSPPPPSQPATVSTQRSHDSTEAFLGNTEEAPRRKGGPERIDISAWWDPDKMLADITREINIQKGPFFQAFTMPTGYAYVRPELITQIIRAQATRAGELDIANAEAMGGLMEKVIFTVVDRWRTEQPGIIATELLRSSFYGGRFEVTMVDGSPLARTSKPPFYIPFHASAFGDLGALEDRKTGKLKGIASVEIPQKEEG